MSDFATSDRAPNTAGPTGETPSEPASVAVATPPEARAPDFVARDVWSHTDPKSRARAKLFLYLNLALFCGLCAFTHWLHVGQPLDFSWNSYLRPLRLTGPQTQNLYDFVKYPISVVDVPIYGVVVGLLVAAIVALPIAVAILYRFPAALPFCAAVLLLAHMPWMAVTLVGSCILAAVRPFRMDFRFGSALLALLPVLLYLYLATRGATDTRAASLSPEETLLERAPWILALLAACAMLALIVLIARMVNYRPGAVAPVMVFMFATPALLFHAYVGVDQLTYRVLVLEYGPRAPRFEPVQDATSWLLGFVQRQTENPAAQALVLDVLAGKRSEEHVAAVRRRISQRMLMDLMRDRQHAYDACRRFIADHPTSPFVPGVLFVQAGALDTRLDDLVFVGRGTKRELYADFPHVQSEPAWANLLTQYPNSPLAEAARLRAAQLRLRRGDIDGALAALARPAEAPARLPAQRGFASSPPPEQALSFDPEPYRFESRRLAELIRANYPDDDFGAAPLRRLASLDPHRVGYQAQLAQARDEFRASRLYDNLLVRWALAHSERAERMAALRECVTRCAALPDSDALAEALWQLGDLEVLGAPDEAARAAGIARLREIITRFGDTCWATLAAERLAMYERPGGATRPVVAP